MRTPERVARTVAVLGIAAGSSGAVDLAAQSPAEAASQDHPRTITIDQPQKDSVEINGSIYSIRVLSDDEVRQQALCRGFITGDNVSPTRPHSFTILDRRDRRVLVGETRVNSSSRVESADFQVPCDPSGRIPVIGIEDGDINRSINLDVQNGRGHRMVIGTEDRGQTPSPGNVSRADCSLRVEGGWNVLKWISDVPAKIVDTAVPDDPRCETRNIINIGGWVLIIGFYFNRRHAHIMANPAPAGVYIPGVGWRVW